MTDDPPNTLRADPPPPPPQPSDTYRWQSTLTEPPGCRVAPAPEPTEAQLRLLWDETHEAPLDRLSAICGLLGVQRPGGTEESAYRQVIRQELNRRLNALPHAQLSARRQRWRDLWLREIDASDAAQLDAIGCELDEVRAVGTADAVYRAQLHQRVQALLQATAQETPDGRHRRYAQAVHAAAYNPDARPFTGQRLGAEQRERISEELDQELDAIQECALAIEPLDERARQGVLAWLNNRYGAGAHKP